MSSTLGILCLDNEWRITSVSAGAAALLESVKPGSVKLEGALLGDLIPAVAGGGLPSPEILEAALSAKGNITVADFTISPDGRNFVFCISGKPRAEFNDKDVADLYRQNKSLLP